VVGRWTWDRLGEPVTIGGVQIMTGDLVVGDLDGIVIVPASLAALSWKKPPAHSRPSRTCGARS
jgi:regulator of RNase E activity RraA